MGANIFRQEEQIRKSDVYDDSVVPSEANFETNPVYLEDDMNALRSAHKRVLVGTVAGNWWDDLVTPSALETGTQRGVNQLNEGLHAVEKKRVLRCYWGLNSISIASNGDTFDILGAGELPGNTTAAVGAVTTLGTVVASHGGTFGTHALDEVAGTTAISPKNLVEIVDAVTRDPILDGGAKIYGLLQGESGVTDGATITDTTTTRVQISFVKINGAGTDLIAISSGAMDGVNYDYCYVERVRLEDLNEADFLGGASVDVPAGSTVTRQAGYDNQGATPVDVTTNSSLDLEGPGLYWEVRDDLEAILFRITEGSAGGTSSVQIGADADTFNVDAVVNDFLNGASFDTGAAGTTINVGVTANQIDSGGALKVASGGGGNLDLEAAGELNFTDSYRAGSSWSLATGIALADSSAEWDAFETAFGEVSLMNAIVQAQSGGTTKVHATKTAVGTIAAGTDISGPSNDNNIDTDLGDLSLGDFINDYDFYHNGQYLRPDSSPTGANDHDVYPGTSLANGQIKLERKLKQNDEIAVHKRA